MKMPDPTQVETTVPDGTGDADFDAALLEAGAPAEPVADPPAADPAPTDPPAPDPDGFTLVTLENGQKEIRLASGQTYRGKDDAELYGQLARAQYNSSRRITELSRPPEPVAPPPVAATPPAVDPTALAIADLMAPAFGVKNGAELVAAFAEQQRIAQAQQEFMGAQQANFEAANFFRAVPEFSKSQADADKIDQFLQSNQLPFNAKTAEMAYYTLKAKGEMSVAPAAPPRAAAPKNNMPPPPAGTAPANTGKGAPTETDLWAMSADQLQELLTAGSTQ
jgi:hypothetical protein